MHASLQEPDSRCIKGGAMFGLLVLFLIGSHQEAAALDPILRDVVIRRLEAEFETTSNPDSLRFELARAYRETGVVEGRTKALGLLESLEDRYGHLAAYHREVALNYLAGGRFWDARRAFLKAVELEPDDSTSWITIARLLFSNMLRFGEPANAQHVLEVLNMALGEGEYSREALLLKAKTLHYMRRHGAPHPRQLCQQGLNCSAEVLKRSPGDISALLLHAADCLELGMITRANRLFWHAIELTPPEVKISFRAPAFMARQAVLDSLNRLPPAGRGAFLTEYWRRLDPTPLTLENECQLAYWSRLARADAYFGETSARDWGWLTDPGEVFVRYGFPHTTDYESSNPLGAGQDTLRFSTARWKWHYAYRDLEVDLDFLDLGLAGTFCLEEDAVFLLERMKHYAPAVFNNTLPQDVPRLSFAQAGFRLPGSSLIRVGTVMGLGPFGDPEDDSWWRGTRLELVLSSSFEAELDRRRRQISDGDLGEPVAGAQILILSEDYDLEPGRYTLAGHVTNPRTGYEGTFHVLLHVEPLENSELQVSGLLLGRPATSGLRGPRETILKTAYLPSPAGYCEDDRELQAHYEIYNLTPDPDGDLVFAERFTIVPRAYLLAHARRIRDGAATKGDSLHLGRIGESLDGCALTAGNYRDRPYVPVEVGQADAAVLSRSVAIPIQGLDAGEYALLVSVKDLLVGQTVVQEQHFRITPGARMLTYLRAGERRRAPEPQRDPKAYSSSWMD